MFLKGPGELAVSITISFKPKEFGGGTKAKGQNELNVLSYCRWKFKDKEHDKKKCLRMKNDTFDSPLSEGEGGSLSSRSSADDMVPVEGVLGNRLLKSPEQ